MTVSGFDGVDKHAKPERSLLTTLKKHAGRNSYGRITVRHHGGGNKRKYRIIDFKRDKLDVAGTVLRLEYDPNRSAFIALVEYPDKELRYMLAPVGLKAGDVVIMAAATSASTASSTSSATRSAPLTSCVWSTIPTAAPTSLWSSMRTARSATFWLPSV